MRYSEDKKIGLEFDELVPAIMTKANYDQCKSKGTIKVHGRGGNGRSVLIEFDSLPQKYKALVIDQYGDPRRYIVQQPILDIIQWDSKAEQFYREYKLSNGMKLPDQDRSVNGKPQKNYVFEYTNAASWLNTIAYLTSDKKALKNKFNISISEFWNTISDLIKLKKVALPTAHKRLKEKLKMYYTSKGANYEYLVEAWRFGNTFSKKVDDDIAEALLLEMIAHGNQHDYTIISKKYNEWAGTSNKATITASAVAYWAKKHAALIEQSRFGVSKYYNKYVKHIHRERASCPLGLVGSDDNVLDLYFRKETVSGGKKQVNSYFRPVLYVVMDSYNDYILGYAVGETVTIDLIRSAYLNAIHHIKQITGEYYLPHQLQMDRWGLDTRLNGTLGQFYRSIAIATPATARAAQGKYIESAFGTRWHQALKEFPNYAGHNISAKERLAPEVVEGNKKDFPTIEEAGNYIEAFINYLREDRLDNYLSAFRQSEKSKERLLSVEKRLVTFGCLHVDKHGKAAKNTLLAGGLTPTIEGKRRIYDIPEEFFPYQIGKKVEIWYDPYDLSAVFATDGKGLRFIARPYQKLPGALIDFKPGDRERLNNHLNGKKRIAAVPAEAKTRRKELLERAGIDAQSYLQSGALVKEIRQLAERSMQHQLAERIEPEVVAVEINAPIKIKSRIGRY